MIWGKDLKKKQRNFGEIVTMLIELAILLILIWLILQALPAALDHALGL